MPFANADARRAYQRKYKREHPEMSRRWRLSDTGRLCHWREKDIHITLEKFRSLLEEQNHQCKICGRADKGFKKRLAVDHDHETGLVRGLLCGTCNTTIGLMKNDWTLLERAANYIRSFNA